MTGALFRRRAMQLRDVFAMRAHYGWAHFMAHKAAPLSNYSRRYFERLHTRLSAHTDMRSMAFDEKHGTDTFARGFFPVAEGVPKEQLSWGYGPVNQDFFREILHAVNEPFSSYTFIDVGAGKGAALMFASEFGFRRYLGVELSPELIEIGRRNVALYKQATARRFEPEWVQQDFMQWPIPPEESVFFLNNPLPPDLSVAALRKIEQSVAAHPRHVLLIFRKCPALAGDYLHASKVWRPRRLAPYWRVYESPGA